jgi:hypothetical protein
MRPRFARRRAGAVVVPLFLLVVLGAGLLLFGRDAAAHAGAASPPLPPAPPPPPVTLPGLVWGSWYRVLIRSTFDRRAFGLDAARQQIQALAGRQGFDVREVTADETDPYVYRATGVYRGARAGLGDVPGVIFLGSAPATAPASAPAPEAGGVLRHIDARPVPLERGVRYFARVSLSWPTSMLVTKPRILAELAKIGGTNTEAYLNASELPATWPQTERGGDAFIATTYQGEPKPLELPGEVLSVWRIG